MPPPLIPFALGALFGDAAKNRRKLSRSSGTVRREAPKSKRI